MKNYLTASRNDVGQTLANDGSLKIDTATINQAASVLRAINHKLRCEILQLINQEEYINVTDIYLKMGLEQTVVSQHLAILRQAGYAVTQRDGKCIYYSLNHRRIHEVHALVQQVIPK